MEEINSGPEEPTPLDPEFERLLSWFVTSRRRVAWTFGFDQIYICSAKPDDPLDESIVTIGVKEGKRYVIRPRPRTGK